MNGGKGKLINIAEDDVHINMPPMKVCQGLLDKDM